MKKQKAILITVDEYYTTKLNKELANGWLVIHVIAEQVSIAGAGGEKQEKEFKQVGGHVIIILEMTIKKATV